MIFAKACEKALREDVERLTSELDTIQQRHHEETQDLQEQVHSLTRELEISRKLVSLREESVEATKSRTIELEGILRELTVRAVVVFRGTRVLSWGCDKASLQDQSAEAIKAKDMALAKEEEVCMQWARCA